jgi:hypothetical protein
MKTVDVLLIFENHFGERRRDEGFASLSGIEDHQSVESRSGK